MQEHIDRLVAARLQCDIMGTETLLVARTDSEAATLLDSNIDPRDHPFILGTTNEALAPLNTILNKAQSSGASAVELGRLRDDWHKKAALCTYQEAVAKELQSRNEHAKLSQWNRSASSLSNADARALAAKLGVNVFWDWDKPRTREGYLPVKCGVEYSIARCIAFAPYCDLMWMETKKPIISQAKYFADAVHAVHPHAMLAYNLSPSFNWSAAGMNDDQIQRFQQDLADLGFCWQFVTVAGFHASGLIISQLAKDYGTERRMLAYVNRIQREEEKHKVETLTHQKWSGANLIDAQLKAVTGGTSSTLAMGKGVTEDQFGK